MLSTIQSDLSLGLTNLRFLLANMARIARSIESVGTTKRCLKKLMCPWPELRSDSRRRLFCSVLRLGDDIWKGIIGRNMHTCTVTHSLALIHDRKPTTDQ